MKWGRRTAVITIACAGGLAIALLSRPSQEPVYQGHRLSWWIDQYGNPLVPINTDSSRHTEAERAIQQIGTNALPTLLDWIRYEEPPWRTRVLNHPPAWARPLLQYSALRTLVMGSAHRHAYIAIWGIEALGTVAHPAALDSQLCARPNSPTSGSAPSSPSCTCKGRRHLFSLKA